MGPEVRTSAQTFWRENQKDRAPNHSHTARSAPLGMPKMISRQNGRCSRRRSRRHAASHGKREIWRVKKRPPPRSAAAKERHAPPRNGRPPRLTDEEERTLVSACREFCSTGSPISRNQLRSLCRILIESLPESRQRKIGFANNIFGAGWGVGLGQPRSRDVVRQHHIRGDDDIGEHSPCPPLSEGKEKGKTTEEK